MRVVKLLVGYPPRTVSELIKKTDVTRTAITEQLNELEAAGFVERTVEKLDGRGRPHHRFAATRTALVLLFVNNQRLVVPAIWKAVDEIGGDKLMKKVLRSINGSLAAYYRAKIIATDPKERLRQYIAILRREGGLVDLVAKDDRITITKRSCAFISMLDGQRRVCAIDLKLMSAIAGQPVRLISCRHDGGSCCQFEIDVPAAKRSRAAHSSARKKAHPPARKKTRVVGGKRPSHKKSPRAHSSARRRS